MSETVLKIKGLAKSFDGIVALDDLSFGVGSQEILGLIGPNGAGKTTLFNVISGFICPERGSSIFRGRELIGLPPYRIARTGIARTFQELRLVRRISVLDNVLLAFRNQPGERLSDLFFRWKLCRTREAEDRRMAMSLLRDAGLETKASDLAEALSYGEQKLLTVVCCLATTAEMLLLDEPVAGIAPTMIERILPIIRNLPRQGRTVLLIEHNLDVVMQVCDRVIFMDAGRKISEGTPQEVRDDPSVIEAYID